MLLRQLAAGLSSYRLFPGDIEQSAFRSAVARIQDSARQPLSAGTVSVEIRGRTFVTSEGPLPEDETTSRLAVACYERRVEELHLRANPDATELAAMYDALTRAVDEVAAAGGVETLLTQAGVTSLSLAQVEPHPIDAVVDPAALAPDQAQMWEALQEERALSIGELESSPAAATEVYGRFRDLVAALPPAAAEDPELYRRLHRAVTGLPQQVRRDLVAVLVDESRSEPVAERMVGTITDHQLGQLLVELGEDGEHDPVQLAKELVARRSRQKGLVELVRELGRGGLAQTSTGTPFARQDREAAQTAIGEIVAEGPVAGHDATAVRQEFPETEAALRAQARTTLRDYLAVEEDTERLKRVLDMWVREVRASLLQGGGDTTALMEILEGARAAVADGEREAVMRTAQRRILDVPFLQEMLGTDLHADSDRMVELLGPLGESSVEGLMDVLGEETDRARRSTLVSMLARLAGSYPAPVEARLDDDRWYVVRNAVNIMHKAEGGRDRLELLEKAASHPHAAVRREVIWGLVSVLGADAAPHMQRFVADPDSTVRERAIGFLGSLDSPAALDMLAGVARSSDDPKLRRRALEELSHNPSAGATRLLRQFAGFRSRPRLPWSLRRYARKLSRGRREAA
jgi:hypothetical protein